VYSAISVQVAGAEFLAALVSFAAGEGEDSDVARRRFERDVALPERRLLVAIVGDQIAGYGRTGYFTPPVDAPANVAPEGYYLGGLLVGAQWRRRGLGGELTVARVAWVFEHAPEVWYFTNARNRASLELHFKAGFAEVTRDFVFPGVSFDGGVGVLCRARRAD